MVNRWYVCWYKSSPIFAAGEGIRQCKGTDTDSCDFYFTYTYNSDNEVKIVVQETKSK